MVSKITCNASNTKVKTCSAASGRLFGRSLKGISAHVMLPDLRKCLQPEQDHRPMSRGHGQVQRSLLATLRRAGHFDGRRDGGDCGLDTLTLA
jgi:hypothetical protein